VWTTALGKILTLDNSRKSNVIVVDYCYMGKKSGESIDHLLPHFEVTRFMGFNFPPFGCRMGHA
jgi:hypothetical protein